MIANRSRRACPPRVRIWRRPSSVWLRPMPCSTHCTRLDTRRKYK